MENEQQIVRAHSRMLGKQRQEGRNTSGYACAAEQQQVNIPQAFLFPQAVCCKKGDCHPEQDSALQGGDSSLG